MERKILYIQYTDPGYYPPLEHSSKILAEEDWKVIFLGIEVSPSGNNPSFSCSFIRVYKLAYCGPGWFQKFHYLWFCLWVFFWALLWRPEVIYASDPFSSPIGLLIKIILRIRVIYHEHDSFSYQHKPSFFIKMILRTRKRLAHCASLCVLPNAQRSEHLLKQMGSGVKVATVWNCPLRREVVGSRFIKDFTDGLKIIHQGTIGPNRLPTSVFEALAGLPKSVSLSVIGYETIGSKGYLEQLKDISTRLGIDNRVEFFGRLSRKEMLNLTKKSNVGLCFVPMHGSDYNSRFAVGASGKLFDYLACGLAVLVPDLPEWQDMYVRPGFGLACNPADHESIAARMLWFFEHPKETLEMGEKGRQKVLTEWNYENQFALVNEILNGR